MTHTFKLALFVTFAALALTACGDDRPPPPGTGDAGDSSVDGDAGDPCEGLTLCAAAGTSCTGDSLVTCAANTDGCLVETALDCTATGGTCDDSGSTAMCDPGPCAGVPAPDRCDTEGRTCDIDTLVDCAPNTDGCLVATRTVCDATPGGECDASADPVMCVLPADPCAGITECAAEGTSCAGDVLTTCRANAFGCLIETTEDCTSRTGGACDDTGAAALCTADDPCAGITECAPEGTSCAGPELVTCAADPYGCLVEAREDCSDTTFGFCDAGATPAPMCSTAATDPCMGLTICTTKGRMCTGDSLDVCALNAFGCLVETTTDCTATGDVCDVLDETPQCGNVCSFRATTCPGATYCDAEELVTCTADADGCLVEDSRAGCGDGVCGGDACYGMCADAAPIVIDCASGTVSGDTSMGTMAIADYDPCTTLTYPSMEQVFLFRNTGADADVEIVSTRLSSTDGDYDLFVLDGGDGTASCGAADTCVDSSTSTDPTETVDFFAPTGDLFYVVYDKWGAAETTTFDLAVTCTPVVCGDGLVSGGEECDDGNTADTDGCSATCTTETGYICSGEPSTCSMPPANAFCASATAIAADMTITGEDISTGGPRPMGTGCGTSDGNSAYYYEVTIPANTQVFVSTDSSGLDRVLLFQDSCAAADCSFRTDSSPESGLLVNATASPVTRIVAVHNYSSGATGTYDITFTYGVIPTVASITAACADLSTATALGVPGDDDASAVTALPFSFDYLGDTTSHFSATSNGFMQLWTSSTGSPSTTFTNGSLPSTATPNGVIAPFWDDLSPNTGADIYTATLGSAGSQRFVVEWRDWSRYEGTEELTFQAHLLEATGEVELHYCTMTPGSDDGYSGSSATIGLENIAGTNGVQISRNTTGAVMTGTGFSITP